MNKQTTGTMGFAGVTRRSLLRGCVFVALLTAGGLLTPGCSKAAFKEFMGFSPGDESPKGLEGSWMATLNPETVAIEVPMALNTDDGGVLAGSIGGASVDGGKYSGEKDGSTIEFQTGAVTVEGPTGELTVEGPLSWAATLRGGALDGTVTGPDGRSSRWTARRSGS